MKKYSWLIAMFTFQFCCYLVLTHGIPWPSLAPQGVQHKIDLIMLLWRKSPELDPAWFRPTAKRCDDIANRIWGKNGQNLPT